MADLYHVSFNAKCDACLKILPFVRYSATLDIASKTMDDPTHEMLDYVTEDDLDRLVSTPLPTDKDLYELFASANTICHRHKTRKVPFQSGPHTHVERRRYMGTIFVEDEVTAQTSSECYALCIVTCKYTKGNQRDGYHYVAFFNTPATVLYQNDSVDDDGNVLPKIACVQHIPL